ncbi:hypothetical protein HZH68_011064 [Vespula germanica]|uniref:Uncharacterized protein n=1 Tax=Vespula germanica TaxID=30212 RepID=A0A834JN09_VESGE|nr:hypothetical protein HZH68_011064 [Vespula germanica]
MSSLPSIVLLANKENRSKEVWERDLVVGGSTESQVVLLRRASVALAEFLVFVKGCHEQVLWSWLQIGPILCPPEAIKLLARRRPMLPAFNAPMHAKSSTQDDIQRNHPRPTAIADSSTIDCFSSTVINVIFQRSPIIPDWN